jgi:hypothetical protein
MHQNFIESNIPKGKKASQFPLGVVSMLHMPVVQIASAYVFTTMTDGANARYGYPGEPWRPMQI